MSNSGVSSAQQQQTVVGVQIACTESQRSTIDDCRCLAANSATSPAAVHEDDILYYNEETEKIMSVATKVRTKAATQRRNQVDALDERRAQRQTPEQLVKSVLLVVDKVDEMKQRERDRQAQIVKDRLKLSRRRGLHDIQRSAEQINNLNSKPSSLSSSAAAATATEHGE